MINLRKWQIALIEVALDVRNPTSELKRVLNKALRHADRPLAVEEELQELLR